MIREATPFLNFDGDCRKAMALYESALGAVVKDVMPWAPEMFDDGVVPEAMEGGVMYARLLMGEVALEMSDVPPDAPLDGGSQMSVNLHFDDPEELDRCFAALAEGGQVLMAPENTFWGARFGRLVDAFGIPWMLHCQLES